MKRSMLILFIASIVLSACTTTTTTPKAEMTSTTSITVEETDNPPVDLPTTETEPAITLMDALGRQVIMDQQPQRIVVTGRAVIMVLDAIYMFPEAYDRVVTFDNASQSGANFIKMIDADFDAKATLVQDAGVEQVVVAKPDLVIMKSSQAEKLGQPLEALDIPVVYVDLETPDQYYRDIAILGQVFQNEARAQELINAYQSRVDTISQAIAVSAFKPRVLMLYYTDRDGAVAFNVPPAGWMQTRITEMAGADPMWVSPALSEGWNKVGLEQIATWDADEIFIISYTSDPSEVVSTLLQDPQWQDLRAVKEGKLHAFPGDIYSWDQPDSRWILGLTWMAQTLQPNFFVDVDILKEAQSFYELFYGLDEAFFVDQIQPTFRGDLP